MFEFFVSLPKVSPFSIYKLFDKYGDIDHVHFSYSHPDAFHIKFRHYDMTSKLEAKPSTSIRYKEFFPYVYLVKVLHEEHSALETSEVPPQKPNILDMLSDNCLLHIFEQPIVTLKDLCRLAKTCKRFGVIARTAYNRKRCRLGDYAGDFSIEPLWLIDSFIRNFATEHENIDMTLFGNNQDIVAGMINEYCEKVSELRVKAVEPSHIDALRPLMTKVRRLDLICATSVEFTPDSLFGAETDIPLEVLKIQHKRPIVLPRRKLAKLTTLHLKSIYMHDECIVETFFKLNPQITKLYLEDVHCYFQLDNIIRHYLSNLEEFAFVGEGTPLPCRDMSAFSSLKSLRKLFLWVDVRQATLALEALHKGGAQLECVTLELEKCGAYEVNGNLVHFLSKLKTLTHVEISNNYIMSVGNEASYSMVDDDLLQLVWSLSNLKELRIESHALTIGCIETAMPLAKQLASAKFTLSDASFDGIDSPDFTALAEYASRDRIRIELEFLPYILVSIYLCS